MVGWYWLIAAFIIGAGAGFLSGVFMSAGRPVSGGVNYD